VIADEHGVESLAGIMGGEASGCDENTTDVLIESALWNEINIAQSGRKLGINRMRATASSAASIRHSCAGTGACDQTGDGIVRRFAVGETSCRQSLWRGPRDRFPALEVKRLAGIEVPLVEMKRILGHLGFMLAEAALS
jgi:phenylalanyl-tRNA synthetase beta chain